MHENRFFPPDPATHAVARRLYGEVRGLPIVSPHGHTDPRWFAENASFADPARLIIVPDHYLFRMLHSQGIPLERLGIQRRDGGPVETDPRAIWRLFAGHYHLFRGTPSRLWLDHVFHEVFGFRERLSAETADAYYDQISDCLTRPAFRPRALFDRFGIEVLATTESPLDDLRHHRVIRASGWPGRVIPTFRPDTVTDPEHEAFPDAMAALRALTGADVSRWGDYLDALRQRRAVFADLGATATDHGPPSPQTADLDPDTCQRLLAGALAGALTPEDAALALIAGRQPERASLLEALGSLYCHGFPVDWDRLHPEGGRFIPLPRYPWQREFYWLESKASAWDRTGPDGHVLLGIPVAAPT